MNQQSQEQEPSRSQRMTEDEAKAVIDLWQQERIESGGLTTSPAVQDVAEGLDISVEDVQRLLRAVRARQWGEDGRASRGQPPSASVPQRLVDEERQLAAVRREWERTRRRQAERSPSSAFGISLPPAEELTEMARNEARIGAESRRFGGFLLAMIGVIVVLMLLLASLLH